MKKFFHFVLFYNIDYRNLCETLIKTGASAETVATTMMGALRKILAKSECDIMKDTGRTLFEQGIRGKWTASNLLTIEI
jgi:hypothetical protein